VISALNPGIHDFHALVALRANESVDTADQAFIFYQDGQLTSRYLFYICKPFRGVRIVRVIVFCFVI